MWFVQSLELMLMLLGGKLFEFASHALANPLTRHLMNNSACFLTFTLVIALPFHPQSLMLATYLPV
jgi:hypothetical protein